GAVGVTTTGEPWQTRLDASISPFEVGGWAEATWRPAVWIELVPGARVTWLGTSKNDHLSGPSAPVAGGAPVLAPKGVITLGPDSPVRVMLAGGRGFRSAETLGIGDGGRLPATTADTLESAVAATPHPRADTRVGAFATW